MLTLNMMTERIRIAVLVSSSAAGGPPHSLRRRTKRVASAAVSASRSAARLQVSFCFLLYLLSTGRWRERESGRVDAREWPDREVCD